MSEERRLKILDRLAGDDPGGLDTQRLCDVCAEVTGMSGAAIMLMYDDVPKGSLGASGEVAGLIDRLQYDLGEGPCVDAYRLHRVVLEPDLAEPAIPRWLAFTGPAVAAGARAVFGFPLQTGSVCVGALNLHRDTPGALEEEQHADTLVMAEVATEVILLLQADAPPGQVAAALETRADFHFAVHQAAGMVSIQLDITVGQALIRLRAYAFGNDRPLADVARAVVARTLHFDPHDGEMGLGP